MNIGIVIDKLYPGKIGGAEQYIRNIIDIFSETESIEMVLFLNEHAISSFESNAHKPYTIVKVPYELKDTAAFFEYYIAKHNIQVMFCPLFYVPYENCSVPMVTTIHDIQYEYYPQYFTPEILNYRIHETKKAVDNSQMIITISEFSKQTIIDKLGMNESQIRVIYENADGSFDKITDEKRNADIKQKLPFNYIFYPANGWEHKNHKRLVDAYKILKNKYQTTCKLVLTGNANNDENKLQDYIYECGLTEDVVLLGYVEQNDMPYIFRNARMLVFPSLFEGFGIPLVEAMRAEIPIACSNCASIPEIASDAAIVFDPFTPEDIAKKMHTLETDDCIREQLVEKGRQRAMLFSWEKCAKQTQEVLEEVVSITAKKEKNLIPKVNILVSSFGPSKELKKLLSDIEKQNYSNKTVTVIKKTKDVKRLLEFVDKESIVVIFQNGQSLENENVLENIVLKLLQTDDEILWIKPQRDDFWGLLLHSSIQNKTYQTYIDLDKISCCVPVLKGETKNILEKIPYWFGGHYQQALYTHINRDWSEQNIVEDDNIQVKIVPYFTKGRVYKKSLKYLLEENNYISLSSFSDREFEKLNYKYCEGVSIIQKYYKQITKSGIEFDGITADGWISRNCEIIIDLKKGDNLLTILGENQVLKNTAILDIFVDNEQVLKDCVVDSGQFKICVNLSEDIEPGGHIIKLRVGETFSYYAETKKDIRALSIRLFEISVNNRIVWKQ